MRKRTLPLGQAYRLLEAGPVVLLTTARKGRSNVMAMSWHTMLEFEPPLVGCVVSNRNFTFAALRATKECVLAIPTVELATKVVRCGNVSGRRVDKFAAFAGAGHGGQGAADCRVFHQPRMQGRRHPNGESIQFLRP